MLVLQGVTDTIQAVLGGAVATAQPRCVASWRDITTTAYTPGRSVQNTNSAVPVTIVAAPVAATQRVIDYLSIFNVDTAPVTLTVRYDAAGTNYTLFRAVLAVNEKAEYVEGTGWRLIDASGAFVGIGNPGLDGADGAPGAPGVGTTGLAVLDFGGFPGATDALVTVTGQAGIVAGSVVEAWARLQDTADHSADEHWVENLQLYAGTILAGIGFTIYGRLNDTIDIVDYSQATVSRSVGPGVGTNQIRPEVSLAAKRLWGQWNVQWRWS